MRRAQGCFFHVQSWCSRLSMKLAALCSRPVFPGIGNSDVLDLDPGLEGRNRFRTCVYKMVGGALSFPPGRLSLESWDAWVTGIGGGGPRSTAA